MGAEARGLCGSSERLRQQSAGFHSTLQMHFHNTLGKPGAPPAVNHHTGVPGALRTQHALSTGRSITQPGTRDSSMTDTAWKDLKPRA